ncbi:MAG TPA: hypothetical protein VE954_01280 [Oligoflexus sp.]|uniref:hypothetical protein n=1 Tax=Oligoflexus sp. TaxID=1971216 RepID=UPI002D4E1C2D|nr:hypothetical protein [Oligoflexus sp.]HYX31714.1 hypothetical protein [Oligoflexus sp.]
MKVQLNLVIHAALAVSAMIGGTACNKTAATQAAEEAPADIESAYFGLSAEVQKEILGVEARPLSDVRKELMAKADKDGDGILSEQEKTDFKAQWKEMKDQLRAELKASLDKNKDGTVSEEEKKAGLEALGQQIKTAIHATLEEIRTAQQDMRDKIKAACSKSGDAGKPEAEAEPTALKDGTGRSANQGPADDLDAESTNQEIEKELNACQTVVQAEKDKMHEMLKASLEKLHAELDELKGKLGSIDEAQSA